MDGSFHTAVDRCEATVAPLPWTWAQQQWRLQCSVSLLDVDFYPRASCDHSTGWSSQGAGFPSFVKNMLGLSSGDSGDVDRASEPPATGSIERDPTRRGMCRSLFVCVIDCSHVGCHGRAQQHSDDLSHQAWLKMLQGVRLHVLRRNSIARDFEEGSSSGADSFSRSASEIV